MRLCGEFVHSLDAKNRIFIPAKYREVFGEKVMVVRDFQEKCLLVYSVDDWEKYETKLFEAIPPSESKGFRRYLYRTSLETGYDSQGRIMLTSVLCEHAELQKGTAIIVGCGGYAEIWSEANYKENIAKENPSEYNGLCGTYGV